MTGVVQGVLWLLGGVVLFVLASALAFKSWRRYAKAARGKPGHALPRTGPKTPLDQMFDTCEAEHPNETGLAGLFAHSDAFAARALSAQMAGRSLDLMYFIWSSDLTGRLLLRDVTAAADRGVRVRLLLDDANVQGFDLDFLSLNQHPNVEVRLFNPIRNRGHIVRRVVEMLLGMSRYNRRLHCKAWIADGRMAIIGGRNIGDSYFGAPQGDKRFAQERARRDADMLVAGPLVAEVEALFDTYWNLGIVLPILALWPKIKIRQRRFRSQLAKVGQNPAAKAFLAHATLGKTGRAVLADGLYWTTSARVLADPPDKAYGRRTSPWMAEQVNTVLTSARHDIKLITPYFVPGFAGLAALTALLQRGIRISVLTNALATSDNVLVHGAYRWYRKPLLAAGARLFEFAPPGHKRRQRDVLHAKVFLIDGTQAIVGSLNFDLRSAYTNSEMGILFSQPDLVKELTDIFDQESGPDQAYALSLDHGAVRWSVARPGVPAVMRVEPEANVLWRAVSFLVGLLPIHGWL